MGAASEADTSAVLNQDIAVAAVSWYLRISLARSSGVVSAANWQSRHIQSNSKPFLAMETSINCRRPRLHSTPAGTIQTASVDREHKLGLLQRPLVLVHCHNFGGV